MVTASGRVEEFVKRGLGSSSVVWESGKSGLAHMRMPDLRSREGPFGRRVVIA
jgi:hypothetical protein